MIRIGEAEVGVGDAGAGVDAFKRDEGGDDGPVRGSGHEQAGVGAEARGFRRREERAGGGEGGFTAGRRQIRRRAHEPQRLAPFGRLDIKFGHARPLPPRIPRRNRCRGW